MKQLALITIALLAGVGGHAQVRVDHAVELVGASDQDRRVEGLAPTLQPEAVVNAGVAQSGAVHLANSIVGNVWAVDLPQFGNAPANGANVVLQVPEVSPSPVSIILNGSSPIPVLRDGAPVTGDQLVEGSMLSVVLAEGAFHILNGTSDLRRACPPGAAAVNEQYCIDPNERGSGTYFEAGLACAAAGMRLCSWAEFVAACQRSAPLQLNGMTNGWEWTNNTSNEDNSGRIAGLNSCEAAGNWLSTGNPVAFRCCFTR